MEKPSDDDVFENEDATDAQLVAIEADARDPSSPPSKRRRLEDGEEQSVLQWVQIDKTPDSGRKKQMGIGSFSDLPSLPDLR